MSSKTMKLLTVPGNGQISIGKSWAGRQICVESVGEDKILISAGAFVPDSQKVFSSEEAHGSLSQFNEFEKISPPVATDINALFSTLKKKKAKNGKREK